MFKVGDSVTPTRQLTGRNGVIPMGAVGVVEGITKWMDKDIVVVAGINWLFEQWMLIGPATPAAPEGHKECKESTQDLMAYGCRCGSVQRYRG